MADADADAAKDAWVECDSCGQWRRVPGDLRTRIEETSMQWYDTDVARERRFPPPVPRLPAKRYLSRVLPLSPASGPRYSPRGPLGRPH